MISPWCRPDDSGMRIGDKVADGGGMPMVTAGKTALLIHALLHDRPFSFGSNDERMEIDLETVGDGVVIDSGGEAAGSHQRLAVEAAPFGNGA